MTIYKHLLNTSLAVLLLLTASSSLFAREYLVNSAIELKGLSLNPGDVVIMKDGIWTDQKLILKGTGTPSEPITLRAESGGQVILTGSSNLKIYGEYLVVDGLVFADGYSSSEAVIEFRTGSSQKASHCRLSNTKIINYNPASKDTQYKWVSLYGQYNRVDHCHFEGKTHNGALLVIWKTTEADYHQIDHNYFGPRPDLGYNGGEIIRIGTSDFSMSDSYTVVEHNLFEGCDGEIEIISNKSCNNTYRYNTFRNSEGSLTLRHGNNCEVYSNFFFGVSNKDCGGIRIIGENHKVYNNYLQDIPGDEYRAAISIVNGVPDSPLNRYFQVIAAQVVNNTLVNCKHPLVFGAGADSEKSLPPKDCQIINNVVAAYTSSTSGMIEYEDDPININYQNNLMYGAPLGIPEQEGIALSDPVLKMSDLWRPEDTSPLVAYGVTDIPFVSSDIDGQDRIGHNDAGCDQLSPDSILNQPLEKSDVGVGWASSIKKVSSAQGGKVLRKTINTAEDGDIIILTSGGGVYEMDSLAVSGARIKIIAQQDLDQKPIVKPGDTIPAFLQINEGGQLSISGIEIFGTGSDPGDQFSSGIVLTGKQEQEDTTSLLIQDCFFHNFQDPTSPAFFFTDSSFCLMLEVSNTTFSNISGALISSEPRTGSTVSFDHCTIDSVGSANPMLGLISLEQISGLISNCVISNCSSGGLSFELSGPGSLIDYCLFWNAGQLNISGEATEGDSLWWDEDPLYAARDQMVYSLLPLSLAIDRASEGFNLGDLFWDVNRGQPGNNALLLDLQVNDASVDQFDPYTFSYQSVVDDPALYTIKALSQDENAAVKIFYPGTMPGKAFIEVLAENAINVNYYSISLNLSTAAEGKNIDSPMKIYPNPSEGIVHVENTGYESLTVLNSLGQLVYQGYMYQNKTMLDLRKFPPGIYQLRLGSSGVQKAQTLILK